MEVTLSKIYGKLNDFKICVDCFKINWYENEECVNCHRMDFDEDEKKVLEIIEMDYDFYLNHGYKEDEIDEIETEI